VNQGKILILALVFFLLGGYVCLFELRGGEKTQENEKVKKILDFNPEHANEIKIVLAGKGKTIVFTKDGTDWRIKEPLSAGADPDRIDAFLSIFDYGFIEIIDDSPSDLSQYGLVNPEIELTITVKGKEGITLYTIFFGSSNPAKNACYCQVGGDPRVYLVGALYKLDLEKDVSFYIKR